MKITPELLRLYYLGLCSKEEEQAVEAWLAASQFEAPQDYVDPDSEDDLRRRMWENIRSDQALPQKGKGISWIWFSGIAASLFIIAGYWWRNGNDTAGLKETDAVAYQIIRTAPGQKKKFYLPDSSLVFLNSGSEIRFPAGFTDSLRTVALSGEAFFKVTRDASRPFIIAAGQTEVRVLGTAFNLKSYEGENTSLVVEEGKVGFKDVESNGQIILTAGQAGKYTAGKTGPERVNVYRESELDWKENKLSFAATPLSEIAVILERWYGIEVEIRSPAVAGRLFSGTYDNPPLTVIAQEMSALMKFDYKLTGRKLVIE